MSSKRGGSSGASAIGVLACFGLLVWFVADYESFQQTVFVLFDRIIMFTQDFGQYVQRAMEEN